MKWNLMLYLGIALSIVSLAGFVAAGNDLAIMVWAIVAVVMVVLIRRRVEQDRQDRRQRVNDLNAELLSRVARRNHQ